MKPRVLVIRPQPGNAETAGRLRKAGFDPVAFPLTEIATLECTALKAVPDAVVISSPNSVRHASPALTQSLGQAPVFAVGKSSAEMAAAAGLNLAYTGSGDATDLARFVASYISAGSRVAYPCGRVRRPELEAILSNAGIMTTPLETYDTKKVSYSTNDIEIAAGGAPIDAVLVHSAKSVSVLMELCINDSFPQITDKTLFFSLSPRISRSMLAIPAGQILTASSPEEGKLLEMLNHRFP